MHWVELTEVGGTKLHVNLANIVIVRPSPKGTILRTTIQNPEGKPVTILVQEAAAEICGGDKG